MSDIHKIILFVCVYFEAFTSNFTSVSGSRTPKTSKTIKLCKNIAQTSNSLISIAKTI